MNSYNSMKYLHEALQSVKDQTYHNWEIIFIDNHSTDGSGEYARDFDPRVKYFKTPEFCPLGEARNFGLTKVSGRYLCFLDTDDVWEPEKLSFQLDLHLSSSSPIAMSYSSVHLIDAYGNVIRRMRVDDDPSFIALVRKYDINMQSVMVDLDVIRDSIAIEFDTRLKYCPDFKFFMDIAGSFSIKAVDKTLAKYRIHENALSGRLSDSQYDENILVLDYLDLKHEFDSEVRKQLSAHKRYLKYRHLATYCIRNELYFKATVYFSRLALYESKFWILMIICILPSIVPRMVFKVLNSKGYFRYN